MMLSWACVAYLTLEAMKTPYYGLLFQTQKDKKVIQLVDYAKHLYRNQDPRLERAFPLANPVVPIRFAPTSRPAYLNDESSFQPDAGECYNEALAAVKDKIIFNSSAGPGWYADARRDIVRSEES